MAAFLSLVVRLSDYDTNACVDSSYVNLLQAVVTGEDGALIEKNASKNPAAGKPIGHFLRDRG